METGGAEVLGRRTEASAASQAEHPHWSSGLGAAGTFILNSAENQGPSLFLFPLWVSVSLSVKLRSGL